MLLAAIVCAALGCAETVRASERAPLELDIETRDPDATRARAAEKLARAAAEEVAARLFADRQGSEVDILNTVPSHVWIEFSAATVDDLRRAKAIAEDTDGAFDPTDPPLAELWGLDRSEPAKTPRDFEIEMRMRRVYWEDIEIDEEKPLVRRAERRTEIDLGVFAEGRTVDAALEALRSAGVPAARVRSRGISAAYGGSEQTPFLIESELLGRPRRVPLREGGLAFLAPSRTRTNADGTRIHELIDPRSGRPANHWKAIAVAASDASSAAAYARALFAMGEEAESFLRERSQLAAEGYHANGEAALSVRFPASSDREHDHRDPAASPGAAAQPGSRQDPPSAPRP